MPLVIIKKENIKISEIAFILCPAGIFLFLDVVAWNRSILFVGSGLATLLGNFQVFFVSIFGMLFFKEKLTLKYILSLFMALSGLFLLISNNQFDIDTNFSKGVWLGLVTSFFYALFILVLKRAQSTKSKEEKSSTYSNLFFIYFFTALSFAILMRSSGQSFIINDKVTFLSLFSSGILSSFLGWILISSSIAKVKISIAGLILLLQPVFSYIWEITFFNKVVGKIELLGATIALIAIYIGTIQKQEQ